MLQHLSIDGYRSLRQFELDLGRITVVTGPNGAGKTNAYSALQMLKHAATGQLTERVAAAGGMASLMWAGPRKAKEPHRVCIRAEFEDWAYALQIGVPPPVERYDDPRATLFRSDPLIKLETIETGAAPRAVMCRRERTHAELRDHDFRMHSHPALLASGESILVQLREPERYPELVVLAQRFRDWRFYHEFRCDTAAPARRRQVAAQTPSLADDGSNLVSALRTVYEMGDHERLAACLDRILPDWQWEYESGTIWLSYCPVGMERRFELREASDGMMRYLYLTAILLSPRPPELLVLNEPEGSLSPHLLEPLAEMIAATPASCQILLTTHSLPLARALVDRAAATAVELCVNDRGATVAKPAAAG